MTQSVEWLSGPSDLSDGEMRWKLYLGLSARWSEDGTPPDFGIIGRYICKCRDGHWYYDESGFCAGRASLEEQEQQQEADKLRRQHDAEYLQSLTQVLKRVEASDDPAATQTAPQVSTEESHRSESLQGLKGLATRGGVIFCLFASLEMSLTALMI